MFRTETTVVNGISGAVKTQHSSLRLNEAKILDLKFLNDDALLVLIFFQGERQHNSNLQLVMILTTSPDQFRIIKLPHQPANLSYQQYDSRIPAEPHTLSIDQVTNGSPSVVVTAESGFQPAQMELKEARSERGHIPSRICLLGNDGQTYKVFSLPEAFL